jgi:RNA polymerase sigma factor for flagellar operon FliA
MMTTSRGCVDRTRQAEWKNIPKRGQILSAPAPRRGQAVTPPEPKAQDAWPKKKRLRAGSALESELVEKYVPLVKAVVARLAMTLPPHVDGEDLYSAGLTGLLRAVRQYNPHAGTSFETYARVRIRGAVFDELRRMDWVPRSVHTKARKVQAAMQGVEQAKGRAPTDQEMAKALKIPLAEYEDWVEEIRPASFICLDATYNNETDDSISQYESLPDQRQETPMDGTFRREISGLIATRLRQLPEMQRKVLALYYFEDMRLREIAEIFSLTESRICQIHAQGILAIKSYLQKFDPYFA